MTDPILIVDDLSVTFGTTKPVTAARGVSYQVSRGEFLAIVGESGSGKSVSSLAVMGLLPSSARVGGSIRFDGQELIGRSDKQLSALRGNRIAMVFQDPLSALTPVYTVGQQIVEALRLHDRSLTKAAADARAVELMRTVGIPDPERRLRSYPHEFSGGMRQRVMIAIAIANDPDVIIADEPTTALDVTIQAQVLDALQKAREITGAAIVLITHDLGVVAGYADRVAVMYAGRIVETGDVDDVFERPRMPYTIGLLRSTPNLLSAGSERLVPLPGRPPLLDRPIVGCPFAARCPVALDECRTAEPALLPLAGEGRSAACVRAPEIEAGGLPVAEVYAAPEPLVDEPVAADADVVVEVDDLIKQFPLTRGAVFKRRIGTVRAVDGVSFDLKRGETLGLVGESGCGKTTTVLQLMELVAPQGGSIRFGGRDVAELNGPERRELRRRVQMVFQDPMASLDPRMTVEDIVSEPLTVHGVAAPERRRRVGRMLELVGLEPAFASRYPHEFSGGQRQRIGIARALIVEPDVLVLDEPVSALDVSVQAGIVNLLEELKAKLGLSYLFVAHDLAVVRQIADRIAVMYLGRIVELGTAEEVFSRPRHPYTKALVSAAPVPSPALERSRRRILLEGDLPSPAAVPEGCRFRPRCPLYALLPEADQARCSAEDPRMAQDRTEHTAACHYPERTAEL